MNADLSTASPSRPAGLAAWWLFSVRSLAQVMTRRWYLFVPLGVTWTLAAVRVFVHHTPVLPVLFNWTASVPYHVVYVEYGAGPVVRGDLVIFAFSGPAAATDYPGLRQQPFFKRVIGLPGDVVSVAGRDVFVNGAPAGRAKSLTFDRRPLDPITPGVIPPGYVYVQGTSPDSFDSRYRSSGLVAMQDIQSKVHPIF